MVHTEDITERKRAEQDLQKLSRAVEQTADIVFITDRNGLIEYVNPAFEKITGYRREEVIGKTPGIFKSGEHPASFYERLWKTILEGHPFRSILINKKKDGTTFFEEKTITPLRAEDGTITHFVSTGKDVTERMKVSELLRQSEEKQRLVLSNMHEIVYSIRYEEGNPLTGTVDFVNDPVEDILGFSAEEFRMNPRLWLESLHLEDLAAVQEANERLLTAKKPITRIYRIKHKNSGEYRWMEDHVVPMLATADKKVVGIFGVARDITERKLTEEASKRAEEERLRLLQVLESSLNEIYMFNVESLRFTYVNDGARKNLGYSTDELQSLTPLDLKPEYTEETFRNMIRPLVLREKEVHIFETIHRRKNGTLYPVEVHLQFVETVGSRTFVAIIHDITERKRTQEQLLLQSSMLDQVRNAAIATDLDGKITYWNKFAERLYGWRAEDVLGKQANDLVVPPAGRKRTIEIRNQIDRTGYWEGELEFQRKDGTIIPVHATSALLKDSTGKATGRVGISTDITERKLAEIALHDSEKKYRELVDNLGEVIYEINSAGDITFINPAIRRVSGYKPKRIVGKNLTDLIYQGDRDLLLKRLGELKQGKEYISEYRFISKSGEVRWIQTSSKAIKEGNNFIGARGTLVDITERKRAEEALHESEKKYRELVDNLSDVIYEINPRAEITFVNPAIRHVLGYEPEELVGKSVFDLVYHEDREFLLKRLAELKQGIEYPLEYRIMSKSGEVRWVRTWSKPIKEGNTFIGARGTLVDITERKRVEKALHESEERFRNLVENITDVFYVSDPDGKLIYGSPNLFTELGYTPDEIIGRLYVRLVAPVDRRRVIDYYVTQTRLGVLDAACEFRALRKDGAILWAEQRTRIVRDGAGKVIENRNVIRNMTERKRAEEILHESEDRYRDLVEHSQDLICTHDLEGRILSANPWAAKVLGYEIDTILKMNIRDVLAPEVRGGVDTYLAKIQKRGGANGRLLVQTAAGERRIWEYNNTLRTEGVATPIVRGMARDITERKQAEENARTHTERLQALSKQLLEIQENERRSIARELHDEIGQTLTNLKILLEMSTKAKASNVHESLQEALELISGLIGRVRNLSLNLRPPALDDLGLVPAIRWHLLHRTEKMGIEAHFKAEPEEIHVSGEIKIACFRVAQEALTNVLKHSKLQSVEVQVMKRGANLELTVRDDGTGFDVDSAFRRAAAGESFGLLGMQERVRLAGGTLAIRSEQGRGSEVQATFVDAFLQSSIESERSTEP